MNHPDFLPCSLFFVVAVVVWQLVRYLKTKNVDDRSLPPAQGDVPNAKVTVEQKNSGCLGAIGRAIAMIFILAIPFFIVFLIFVNVVHSLR